MTDHCPTGKSAHASINHLKASARETTLSMNREGEIAPNFYGYRCPTCRKWHLTKWPERDGRPNMLILHAAPLDLQQWAITGQIPIQKENPE